MLGGRRGGLVKSPELLVDLNPRKGRLFFPIMYVIGNSLYGDRFHYQNLALISKAVVPFTVLEGGQLRSLH